MFLIGYQSIRSKDGRGKLLKDLMRLFGRLVSNIEAVKESIFFGFTDVSEDTNIENICNLID